MKGNMDIYYDEEGDFLEINIGGYRKGYFRDIGEGVAERIDEKTGKIVGIAILGFKERTKKLDTIKVSLPIKIKMSSYA